MDGPKANHGTGVTGITGTLLHLVFDRDLHWYLVNDGGKLEAHGTLTTMILPGEVKLLSIYTGVPLDQMYQSIRAFTDHINDFPYQVSNLKDPESLEIKLLECQIPGCTTSIEERFRASRFKVLGLKNTGKGVKR